MLKILLPLILGLAIVLHLNPCQAGASFPPCKMCEVKKVRHTTTIRKKHKQQAIKSQETKANDSNQQTPITE